MRNEPVTLKPKFHTMRSDPYWGEIFIHDTVICFLLSTAFIQKKEKNENLGKDFTGKINGIRDRLDADLLSNEST